MHRKTSHRDKESSCVVSCCYIHSRFPSHASSSSLCPSLLLFQKKDTSLWLCNLQLLLNSGPKLNSQLPLLGIKHSFRMTTGAFWFYPLCPLKDIQVLQFVICPFPCIYILQCPPDVSCPDDFSEVSVAAIVTISNLDFPRSWPPPAFSHATTSNNSR